MSEVQNLVEQVKQGADYFLYDMQTVKCEWHMREFNRKPCNQPPRNKISDGACIYYVCDQARKELEQAREQKFE